MDSIRKIVPPMNILVVSLLLGLVVMEAWSKPVSSVTTIGTTTPEGLIDHVHEGLDVNDDTETVSVEIETRTGNSTASRRLMVGFKLRLLRILLRLFMLRMSGNGAQQEHDKGMTSSQHWAGRSCLTDGMTPEEMCKCLCGLGACPPGCPGNLEPPWGGRRR